VQGHHVTVITAWHPEVDTIMFYSISVAGLCGSANKFTKPLLKRPLNSHDRSFNVWQEFYSCGWNVVHVTRNVFIVKELCFFTFAQDLILRQFQQRFLCVSLRQAGLKEFVWWIKILSRPCCQVDRDYPILVYTLITHCLHLGGIPVGSPTSTVDCVILSVTQILII
jgi:hypothetical protein